MPPVAVHTSEDCLSNMPCGEPREREFLAELEPVDGAYEALFAKSDPLIGGKFPAGVAVAFIRRHYLRVGSEEPGLPTVRSFISKVEGRS
jgi:hypothetical protein